MDERSPLRRAVIKFVISLVVASAIILGWGLLRREPPRIRDAAGRTWYLERSDNPFAAAIDACDSLGERAVYPDGPYAGGGVVSYCCGPPFATSSACDMPSN